MSNPLAQLLGQAEAGLTDLSRRAIESVTLPIKAKGQELAAEVGATIKASLVTVAIKAGLGLFAVVMLMIALGYGLSALHATLALRFGTTEATLIMAGVFFALGVIALLILAFWPSSAPKKTAREAEAALVRARAEAEAAVRTAMAQGQATARTAAAEPQPSAMVDMKTGLGAIASALGEAGFRREQAGLRAGLAIAEQLKPMQIVSLALIGGFVAGMRHRRRG